MWRIPHDCMVGVTVLARSTYVPTNGKAKCTPSWWEIMGECRARRRTGRHVSGMGESGDGVADVFAFDHEDDHLRHVGGVVGNSLDALGDVVYLDGPGDG